MTTYSGLVRRGHHMMGWAAGRGRTAVFGRLGERRGIDVGLVGEALPAAAPNPALFAVVTAAAAVVVAAGKCGEAHIPVRLLRHKRDGIRLLVQLEGGLLGV